MRQLLFYLAVFSLLAVALIVIAVIKTEHDYRRWVKRVKSGEEK